MRDHAGRCPPSSPTKATGSGASRPPLGAVGDTYHLAGEWAAGSFGEPHLCDSVVRAAARSGDRSCRRQRGRVARCQAADMSADAPGCGLLGTRGEGAPRGQGPRGHPGRACGIVEPSALRFAETPAKQTFSGRRGEDRSGPCAACHAGGRGFESRRSRFLGTKVLQMSRLRCLSRRTRPPASNSSRAHPARKSPHEAGSSG
jgi:hypothetical protein